MKMAGLDGRRIWLALALAVAIGACGIAPHVAFSVEQREVTWFYNSYDEGYYGWSALNEPIYHRILAAAGLRTLTAICGGSLQWAMVVADFLFPFLCTLAACFATAAVTRTATGMAAAALLVLTASEMLGFRSTYAPTHLLYPVVESVFRALDTRPGGWFPLGNQTGVFWIFRTPEPQMTWSIVLVAFGCLVRMVQTRKWLAAYVVCCIAGGFGYLLVVLPIFGAICFAGLALFGMDDRRMGLRIFLPALAGGVISFGLAIASASGSGGSTLVFESREPAILLSGILGLAVSAATAVVGWRRRSFRGLSAIAIALGLAPLLMANQQLLTGRMLYLFNFENFAFSLTVALAAVVAFAAIRSSAPMSVPLRWWSPLPAAAMLLLFGGTVAYSQVRGYQHGLAVNRTLSAHADAIEGVDIGPDTPVVIDDIFVTDNLAIRLGWHPNYLLSRDLTFSHAIDRLKESGDVPLQREVLQPRLFENMALTGVTPEEFSNALDAVIDPEHRDWKARFGVGAFLYSFADFWGPLTHGRSLRQEWIAAEKPSLVAEYAAYVARGDWPSHPVMRIGRWTREEWEEVRENFEMREVKRFGETGRRTRVVEISGPRREEAR